MSHTNRHVTSILKWGVLLNQITTTSHEHVTNRSYQSQPYYTTVRALMAPIDRLPLPHFATGSHSPSVDATTGHDPDHGTRQPGFYHATRNMLAHLYLTLA